MITPFLHLNLHTDPDPALAILLVDGVLEKRARLHAQTARPGGARVDVAEGAEGLVGLARVAVARVRVHVGEAAARRSAGYVELQGAVEARGPLLQADLLPGVFVVGGGAGYLIED